jgi:hypothetical protein
MPQGHNAMGGIWEDAQMVSPSSSPPAVVHRGEATNPSFVVSVVDPVRYSHPIVRNDASHVCQVVMPRPGDVSQMAKIKVVISNMCIGISICHDNMDTSYNKLDQNAYIKFNEWWMTIASI